MRNNDREYWNAYYEGLSRQPEPELLEPSHFARSVIGRLAPGSTLLQQIPGSCGIYPDLRVGTYRGSLRNIIRLYIRRNILVDIKKKNSRSPGTRGLLYNICYYLPYLGSGSFQI